MRESDSKPKGAVMDPINPIEKTYRRLLAAGRNPLKLFSGNPNEQGFHFPAQPLLEAYRRYFSTQEYHPHPKGLPVAREAIRRYYQSRGFSLDSENIILTSGTSESFFYLFTLLAKPGDNILAPHPAYPLFEHIAKIARVELRPYVLQEDQQWQIDLEGLKRAADPRTRAVLLVSPNNPTGAVSGAQEIEEIVAWCRQRQLPLICDEVFSEFYFGEGEYPRPAALSSPELCFTLGGLSKMFAVPGLKLGWIAASGEKSKVARAVDGLETIADTFLSCHIPIQEALPEIFASGEEFLHSYRQEVNRRRRLAIDLLKGIPALRVIEPQGGFYLMARVENTSAISEEEWVLGLMEKKDVFVHPGYFFDIEEGIHFVLSFLTEPEKLKIGIQRIGEFLREPA